MGTKSIYHKIVSNTELINFLSEYYDFEIVEANSNTKDYFFEVDDKATIIAQDASGGAFALYGYGDEEDLPVIFISSEGQAGKVGKNFEEFLGIMISCPYWRDLLKFSGNGQLTEMLKSQFFLEDEVLEDFPEIENVKNKVISLLSINELSKPVETLYESMVSEPYVLVLSLEGENFDSLFNTFLVTDNPLWKNKMQ
ncbi:hypothetical protein LOZ80_34720 [Paenibacillus sp. HWE-109]|uniref:hypothetical protein n=1 Tax=Paenibacillus sp. HWE-109 TaxID=1306526 RepID=UPI001EDE9430|nr:hypothetical protein [Paenibacillus sp. HWE-109]UKS26613.1 hypothetical protein LOZ80_34720 [Paenibacillus sp. HWE-109]